MTDMSWYPGAFIKSTRTKALDGVEECARTVMATQAKTDCPVDHGTLRKSIGVERDSANSCCYLGCGGPAKAYAHRQEVDRSLNHTSGKAGFIRDSVEMHNNQLKKFVERHVKG